MWSGGSGYVGAWSVSGWATFDPHFLAWETGETFMTWKWEGSFMVDWHDMTAKWGVVREGKGYWERGSRVLPTFACWFHTDKRTQSASKVMAWVHSVCLHLFVLFHLRLLLLLLLSLLFAVVFLCFSGLEFESLSKAHLTVQCECTHECFLEAPLSLPLPSLLFNVY